MDYWIDGGVGVEYTRLRSKNRGYMSLRIWQRAIDLYKHVCMIVYQEAKIDFKLRAQIADAVGSVAANIAEGYSRRSINEYIQHVYIALGSLSETLTRVISFQVAGQISKEQFQQIDSFHYEVENGLWKLLESLEKKREDGSWVTRISDNLEEYRP